jgi:hypothetical protein
VKLRLIDPSGLLFDDHLSRVEDFLEFIGTEHLLPEV